MKKVKTKDNNKILKIRIIVSSVLLVGFIIGWIIYGIKIYRTNDKTIINKFFKQDINIKIDNNINYTYDETNIGLYNQDDKLYVYGNNKYIDLSEYFNENGLNVNYKELFDEKNNKELIKHIREIILKQYDYVDNNNFYLENSDLYVYNYTFNTSYLNISMVNNKDVMNILEKMFGADKDTISKFLDKYSDRRIEYSIFTKGKKRKIVYYKVRVDGLFSIQEKDNVITGYVDDVVYYKDGNDLNIYINEKEKKINKQDIDINFDEYTKLDNNSHLSDLLK